MNWDFLFMALAFFGLVRTVMAFKTKDGRHKDGYREGGFSFGKFITGLLLMVPYAISVMI